MLLVLCLDSPLLPDVVFAQIALHGKLSGFNLRHPLDTLLAVPLASAAQIRGPAFAWLRASLQFSADTSVRCYPHQFATAALHTLAYTSVYIDTNAVVPVKPPESPLTFQHQPVGSFSNLEGRICKALQKIPFLYPLNAAPNE